MNNINIYTWQSLLRPPLPDSELPEIPDLPLRSLCMANEIVSFSAIISVDTPVINVTLKFSDLKNDKNVISSENIKVFRVGTAYTPEAGLICDPLYEFESLDINKNIPIFINIKVPKDIPAGLYTGKILVKHNGKTKAEKNIQLQVADVCLKDVNDWSFFLSVWMNPGAVARFNNLECWSDEHFAALEPYIKDLALHGQKTVVVPISYHPWGNQTYTPYPNIIKCIKIDNKYEFDFTLFDRYVKLHEKYNINKYIHCYSLVQAPGDTNKCVLEFCDAAIGEKVLIETEFGDDEYKKYWISFLKAFKEHLDNLNWLDKTYLAFDEKPPELMKEIFMFIFDNASDFRISLAANTKSDINNQFDDLSNLFAVDVMGEIEKSPTQRAGSAVSELFGDDNMESIEEDGLAEDYITTFYVCCSPQHPNTFVHSPLIESRMIGMLAIAGGYDGFLRWSYNDWNEDPIANAKHSDWPSGDCFFVYPSKNGPVSSLRWEQLRNGIQDAELAFLASRNLTEAEEVVDYEQAVSLATRQIDGRMKSPGDIELARQILIPIAEKEKHNR
ncbi:MAG: glycoside hydrolase domain-containing protein [Armatimonadota bacterium]